MGYYYGVFSLLTWEGVTSPLPELKYRCWLIRNCIIFYVRILINIIRTARIECNINKMGSEQKPFVPKTPIDFQKLKLERLMANPEKPVIIPEMPKEKKGFTVPEFVRNVMGSSAGAGSGEFHVYRHLRRKEYTRQKMIEEKGEKERLDEEFRRKIEENERMMQEKTAKKRAKRLKRKEKLKKLKAEGLLKCKKVKQDENQNNSEDESSKNENLDSEEDASEESPEAQSSESSRENKQESPKGPES